MTAMHWPSRSAGGLRARWQLACALLATTIGIEAFAEDPVEAVFKAREVSFFYRSSHTLYPCHALQHRVAVILRAVGARDDIDVRATGCEDFMMTDDRYDRDDRFERNDPFGRSDPFDRTDPLDRTSDRMLNRRGQREQMAHVRVRLLTPVKVTPEVLQEIDKDKSRRELISRVTGNPMAAMNDPAVFPAQRQTVTLSRNTIRLEPEDCELLDEMSTSVFRDLDIRVVRGAPNCRHGSRIAPHVTVEALLPVGIARAIPGSSTAPGTGQGNSDSATTAPPEPSESASDTEPAQQEVTTAP